MSSAVPARAPQWGPPTSPPRCSGWIQSGTGSSRSAPPTIPFSLRTEFDAAVYGTMDALILVEEVMLADVGGGDGAGEEMEGLVWRRCRR
jgi:hypothetical protein